MDAKSPEQAVRSASPLRDLAETARLAALHRYGILDTPEEAAFDRIAALARDLFETPIAMVSLIDETRQWFKSRIGLEIREVPRAQAFCDHTILLTARDGVLVIEDLREDPRFHGNPLVVGPPHLRFYAGAPVVAPLGECVGTVSVLDHSPRPLGISDAQRRWLRSLAAITSDELELRLQARLAREAAEQVEAALAAEARLRRAQEAAGVVAFEFGPRGAAEAGAALRSLYGLPLDVPLSFEAVLAVVHPDDRAALRAERERLAARGGAFDHEYRVVLPDGAVRWLQVRGTVLEPRRAGKGPPRRVAGVAQDVTARRAAEEARALLTREVDHRAKNVLAVVQAALRLTPKDDPEAYVAAVEGRIAALARAQALLAQEKWVAADLRAIVEGELQPFLAKSASPPTSLPIAHTPVQRPTVTLEGAQIALIADAVQPLAMALHELATNATKHGALSRPDGHLSVAWRLDTVTRELVFRWQERGGPPVAGPPARTGFGSRLLATTIKKQLSGSVTCAWEVVGLTCEIRLPPSRILGPRPRRPTCSSTETMRASASAKPRPLP